MNLLKYLLLAFCAIFVFHLAGVKSEDEAVPSSGVGADGSEKFTFQAEVTRLMDIIINSLYSKKEVFLRELISNASDALDKIRFVSLTNPEVLGEGEESDLDIRIAVDTDAQILSITDKGIGMTREDLINNLGTIAKSGTSAFFEKLQQAENDLTLIGQFGVGFYSVFLVADKVQVVSKHPDDTQHMWESTADGSFSVKEDTEGEQLARGTRINIFLKDDNIEYSDTGKLKELVAKYSEFINFPIYLQVEKEIEVPIDLEDDDYEDIEDDDEGEDENDDEGDDKAEDDDGIEDEGDVDEDEEEEEEQVQTRTETIKEWELLNGNKAIWLRDPKSVTEDEYNNFYKALSKSEDSNLGHTHFKAEGGDVEFRAILFIPTRPPWDFYDSYYQKATSLKLFVRRVFISDSLDDLLPRYLRFMIGVIDSDTLPLNVSREMLQQLEAIDTVKKKLVRKALELIKRLAEPIEDEEEEDKELDEEEEKAPKDSPKYEKFWQEYGKALKMGIIEDSGNRGRLASLLRFTTSKQKDGLVSLKEYVENMKEGQKAIYFLTGTAVDEIDESPFLERLKAKGYEVLYMTDPMDEYMMQHLVDYEGTSFQNASKDDLKMSDKDDKEKKLDKAIKEEFKPLTTWWKQLLGDEFVERVQVSKRLQTTPCVVVTSKFGWSANMERIMRSQALGDSGRQQYMKGRKVLEINPRHPLIKSLKEKVAEDEEDEQAKLIALSIYDVALLESGFVLDDTKDVARRVHLMAKSIMGFPEELDDVDIPEENEDEEEEEEEEAVETEEDDDEVGEDNIVFEEEELNTEL